MKMTTARGKHSRKSRSRSKLGRLMVMAVVIALAMSMIAGAFASEHFGITSPTAPEGERALVAPDEDVLLTAIGPDTGGVQWAVRTGTCDPNQPLEVTIAGNVDGRTDVADWEDGHFSFLLTSDRLEPTEDDEFYCFVFNPNDGDRYTQEFVVVSTETTKDICKNGGWRDWADPDFRNQGECVSYFEANPNAAFDTWND